MRGYTLLEVVTALVVIGVVAGFAVPRLSGVADRVAVGQAVGEVTAFYRVARTRAVYGGMRVRLEFSPTYLVASDALADTVITRRAGPGRHRVTLSISRETIEIGPSGFGYGAANTTIAFWRGAAVDTLFVSRLGRLRRAEN